MPDFAHYYRLATGYPLDPLVAEVLAEAPPRVLAALPGARALVEAAEAREREAAAEYLAYEASLLPCAEDRAIMREAAVRVGRRLYAGWLGCEHVTDWQAQELLPEDEDEIERAAHRHPGEEQPL